MWADFKAFFKEEIEMLEETSVSVYWSTVESAVIFKKFLRREIGLCIKPSGAFIYWAGDEYGTPRYRWGWAGSQNDKDEFMAFIVKTFNLTINDRFCKCGVCGCNQNIAGK